MGMLVGKVALITGASMGIGSGIAKVFAQEGARLALAARSEQTAALAADLRRSGAEALALTVDVTDPASIQNGVERTVKTYGGLDILVNNAGVCRLGAFENMSAADRDLHFAVNVKGVWDATKAALPYLKKSQNGKIIIMSSVTGDLVADPGEVAYATTKAALIGFTKALAVEVAPHKINVNAICPGYVLTPMAQSIAKQSNPDNPDAVIQGIAAAVPLKRLADPEEVGQLAAFLASPGANYLTGAQFVIDGGSTLPETVSVGAA
ncbi:MAG: SDR family oxidoreductase UcpA [Candidatus Margulisbacteria bacterium]|jgi:NAD(P)-dependent dehydrogenase (short-subunit alcohol dehydrogenase family)|nr:SDR family oxidoreductase UcpA [Candidatus Margulisiibacteriota bacterium]